MLIRDWLSWITYAVGGIALLLLLLGISAHWSRPSTIPPVPHIKEKTTLPESSFTLPQKDYDAIGEPAFTVQMTAFSMQIPDLRQQLTYFGKNSRPDAQAEKTMLNFGLPGSKTSASVSPNQKLYLIFDRKQTPGKFTFSPNNAPTSLWLEASPQGSEAAVKIGMVNEKGETIHTPKQNAQFRLKEKDQTRVSKGWELGKWRVDATLLSRQKARWYGQDKFFERHGGEEYGSAIGKERIDFIEGENPYSVFLDDKSVLIWKDRRWQEATPSQDTIKYPLLAVKKISDRVMNLELWDVEGKAKVNLNLLKSTDMKPPQNIQKSFKYVGAKTRSKFIFEINKERMTLRPKDWLVLTKEGWKKLTTAEEIDDFVNRKLTGPLFVFDGIVRQGDIQIITGTLFNASRTDMQPVEIPVQINRKTNGKNEKTKGQSDVKPNSSYTPSAPRSVPERPLPPTERTAPPELNRERPPPPRLRERGEENQYRPLNNEVSSLK